jgi:hypothetical protein
MITLVVLPLILAYVPGAVWALRVGGLWRLWLLCALAAPGARPGGTDALRHIPFLVPGESFAIF